MTRALVVIDIQNDYFPGGTLPLHEPEATEARIVDAIRHAERAGDRVILVRHESPAQTGLFAKGGSGAAIRSAIMAAAPDAPVVTKQFADAFQETDLVSHLDGVTDLLVCGMMTQNCVAFTAMSRDADGYDVTVVADLCTAPLEVVHLIALSALRSKGKVAIASDLWA